MSGWHEKIFVYDLVQHRKISDFGFVTFFYGVKDVSPFYVMLVKPSDPY